MQTPMPVRKYVNHSKKAIELALNMGWHPGARYTNIRDIKTFTFLGEGFIDIDWKNYDFLWHLDIVASCRPHLTIARDVESIYDLENILKEGETLKEYSKFVAIVPKDELLEGRLGELIPRKFILAYSVPTKYGGTRLSYSSFDRPVHLLGGRPNAQRKIAENMNVISFDCNRFTYDARFGDYFEGKIFKPHPKGGYVNCLRDSIKNINTLWNDYSVEHKSFYKRR